MVVRIANFEEMEIVWAREPILQTLRLLTQHLPAFFYARPKRRFAKKTTSLWLKRTGTGRGGKGSRLLTCPLPNDFIEQQAPYPRLVRLTPVARIAGQPRTDVTDRTADLPHDSRSRADDVCLQEFEL
jgi:hypothetical protein